MELSKRKFFESLTCSYRTDDGVGSIGFFFTLGDGAGFEIIVGSNGVSTLGDACTSGVISGIGCTFFNCVASVNRVFLTGSPAGRLGVVVDGGCVRIDMMSPAACLGWSVTFTVGKGIVVGKKVTVSQSLEVLVCGK